MIKALRKLGTEVMCLNIIKAIYDKPIVNIILHGEKLKPFPLKPGMRQRSSLPPTPIQHSPENSSQSNKARRTNKRNISR
jgi:hypothetical protein